MNDKPDYIGGGWLFYHDTSDKLNKEHLRILELPEEERYGQFLELKRNVCILREKNPYYRGFLSEIIEGIDIELTVLNVKGIALPYPNHGSVSAEPGEGGKNKKSNALKYAIPIERIDNKLWGKKLMKYAYADLRKLSKREKYTDNSLLQGINRQSSGYDQYRRIALTADKIDEKYVAYRLKPQ
jgi:hypothetical protein